MYSGELDVILFESIFYESKQTEDQQLALYKDKLSDLEKLKDDGTPEKIYNGIAAYLEFDAGFIMAAGIIMLPALPVAIIGSLLRLLLAGWVGNKSKRRQLIRLKNQIYVNEKKCRKMAAKVKDSKNSKAFEKRADEYGKMANTIEKELAKNPAI